MNRPRILLAEDLALLLAGLKSLLAECNSPAFAGNNGILT
jgi:hypothetical protein